MRRTLLPALLLLLATLALSPPESALAYVNEWTEVSKPPVAGGMLAISPDFASDSTIFVASDGDLSVNAEPINCGIARSTDAGKTWTKVGYSAGARLMSAIALAPDFTAATGVALAGTSDHPGRLYRSADGGATWTRVGASLPDAGTITDICFSPAFASDHTVFVSYAGGDNVAFSVDGGMNWQVPNHGMGDVIVTDISMSGRAAVLVGEDAGRGVYQGEQRAVLRTADGGRWSRITASATPFVEVAMTGATTAVAVTSVGAAFSSADGGATWQQRGSMPRVDAGESDSTVRGLDMVDPNVGYACGSGLGVYRTVDGGATWSDVSPPSGTYEDGSPIPRTSLPRFADLKALSPTEAWAAVADDNRDLDAATVFHTTDAGRTWSEHALPVGALSQIELKSIDFGDASHGCAVGTAYDDSSSDVMAVAYYTNNGGTSWTRSFAKPGSWLADVSFSGPAACVAVGTLYGATDGRSVILRSANGGATWSESASPDEYPLVLTFADTSRGLLACGGRLFATSDGGATWSETNVGAPSGVLSVSPGFASDRTVLIASAAPASYSDKTSGLYRSTDGGWNWAVMPTKGLTGRVKSIAFCPTFTNDRIMIALNDAHTFFRTTDGGVNWTKVLGPIFNRWSAEFGATFSPNWTTDRTVFVVMQGLMFKSVNSGASFYPLGSHAFNLTDRVALRSDFAQNPVAYSVSWKSLGSYRFGPRGRARFTKPEVSTGATRSAKLLLVRGKIAPMHPHVDTDANMWWGGPAIKFYIQRLSGGAYRPYRTYSNPDFWNFGGTSYEFQTVWSSLPVGAYRVRVYHTCSGEGGHTPSWSSWTKFTRTSGFSYRTWR